MDINVKTPFVIATELNGAPAHITRAEIPPLPIPLEVSIGIRKGADTLIISALDTIIAGAFFERFFPVFVLAMHFQRIFFNQHGTINNGHRGV